MYPNHFYDFVVDIFLNLRNTPLLSPVNLEAYSVRCLWALRTPMYEKKIGVLQPLTLEIRGR